MSSGVSVLAAGPLQLPLDLKPRHSSGGVTYCEGVSNRAALDLLTTWTGGLDRAGSYGGGIIITGPRHSGKSHLARYMAQKLGARLMTPSALPDMLGGEFIQHRYILDNADQAGISDLIRLINQCQQSQSAFILAGQGAPARWVSAAETEITGNDLVTRLLALPEARLAPPDEALLALCLQAFLKERDIEIRPEIAEYAAAGLKRSFEAMVTLGTAIESGVLTRHIPIDKAAVSRMLHDIAGIRLGA